MDLVDLFEWFETLPAKLSENENKIALRAAKRTQDPNPFSFRCRAQLFDAQSLLPVAFWR